MPKESLPEREAERADVYETAGRYLEDLKESISKEALELTKRGFPVTEECRIDHRRFSMLYPEDEIEADAEKVRDLESKFEKDIREKKIGDLLEVSKTLAFNKFWFNQRLVAVRASKYDDYANGIDELVLDTQTHEPLALIDTTTNWESKVNELMRKIQSGGRVKYGLRFDKEDKVRQVAYERLPILILSLHDDEVLRLAADIKRGELSRESRQLERIVKETIARESLNLKDIVPPKIRELYDRVLKIFRELG